MKTEKITVNELFSGIGAQVSALEGLEYLVKCTWVACFDTHNFQEGKVYEVKNGRLIDGHGRKSCNTYDNVYDINDSFYARFTEVKE